MESQNWTKRHFTRGRTQGCSPKQLTVTASKIWKEKAMQQMNLHTLGNTSGMRIKLADSC